MNTRFALPTLLFAAAVTGGHGYAQNKADRKTAQQLRDDISYLASDATEGRGTGSEGERKAADYIIKRYEDAGILPYKGRYRHPFYFIYGKEIAPLTTISIGDKTMRIKDEAFPLPFSAAKHAQGDVLPDIMESGNVWMVALYSDPKEAADPHFDWNKSMFDRSNEARKQGASGILFYDNYGSKWPPFFDRKSELKTLGIPVAFLSYKAYTTYIQTNDADGNAGGSVRIGMNISVKKPERIGTNIAAYIDNKAPYTVVIGTHYDHLGYGEDLYAGKGTRIFYGANDNASGTAGVLAIAAWVKKHKLRHYNYLFVNFSGEELGLLGSKAFIKDEKLDSQHIAYMIDMHMTGRLNDSTRRLTIYGSGSSPVWGGFARARNKQHLKVIADSAVASSDYVSFYNAGIPALSLCSGMYSDYHKPTDTEDKINYSGEALILKYAGHIIKTLDHKPKPAYSANTK